jgi:small-conductance mechanosensitive channel
MRTRPGPLPLFLLGLGFLPGPLAAAPASAAPSPWSAGASQESQQPAQEREADQTPPEEPAAAPISAARFAEEEERTQELVAAIRDDLLPSPRVEEIVRELTELSAVLDALQSSPESVTPSRYPLRRVQNLRNQWSRFDARITSWRRELRGRIETLEATQRDVQRARDLWQATDSTLTSEDASELMRLRVTALLEEIQATSEETGGVLEGNLVIQDRLVREQTRVADQITQLDDRLRQLQLQLLQPESLPLWAIFTGERSVLTPTSDPGLSFQATLDALEAFAEESQNELLFQVMFVALLALALLVARRRMPEMEPDAGFEGPLHVLRHPLSTSLLLGLLLTLPLYTAPPVEVGEIAVLLSIPPTVIILRGLVWGFLRRPLYAIAGLVVLNGLATNLDWVPVLGRLLLVVETVLAGAGLFWLLRKDSPALTASDSRWWRLTLLVSRAAAIGLVISFLANVVGNRSLAELLTDGIVRSSYAAVLLYAGTVVAKGLVRLLPRTRVGLNFRGLQRHGDLIADRVSKLINLVTLGVWIWLVLRIATIWEPVVGWALRALRQSWTLGSFTWSVEGVALFFLAIWLAFKVSQLVRFVLDEEVLVRLDLPKGVPSTISTLTNWAILAVGVLVAAGVAGIDLTRLTLLAGALGVGIGFGLQNLVNNFVSGLILVFERPIAVGDWVQVGTLTGKVQRIGMRSSTVRTFDGAEVIVPNGNLIANEVTNWTLTDRRRRLEVLIGVKYGTDPERVLAILLKVAGDHEEVLAYPEPMAFFTEHGDSSLNFALRAWTHTFEDHFRVRSELTVGVNAALAEAGIEIPFPQRDLHLRSVSDPLMGAIVGGAATAPAPEPPDEA